MRARFTLAAGTAALALAGSVFAAAPALAACGSTGDVCTGTTTATFTLTSGSLQITVPTGSTSTPDTLGGATGAAGAKSVSGALGSVSVNDQRGALDASWSVTAVASNFTTGTATTPETVLAAAVGYTPGTGTSTGTGTLVLTNAASLGTAAPVAAWTVASGVDTASWNPTINFTLLPNQVAGTYQGTITHTLT